MKHPEWPYIFVFKRTLNQFFLVYLLSWTVCLAACKSVADEEYASRLEILGQNKLTNGILSDTIPVEIKIGEYPGIFKSVDLQIDGHIYRGNDAALFAPLPKPTCFKMDTCYLENGRHTVQILASWLNPNPTNPNTIYDNRLSAPVSITVTNDIFYPGWESEIGELNISAYFFKTTHTNADWHIDIYDVRTNFVQRLSGHTVDGKIEAFWHMKDANGVMRTNADLDPEFSSVITVEDPKHKWQKAMK